MDDRKKEIYRQKEVKRLGDDERLRWKIINEENEAKTLRRKDFVHRLQLERREASLNGVVLKAQELATLQQNQLEQEEKLAAELDLIKRQEIVNEKLRLHLRENSHELKELESQLRVAYTNKAIATQLAEKEAIKLEEQIREKRAREVIEGAIGTFGKQEEILKINEKKEKEKFRQLLQDQMIEKERMRQLEFISFMNEKKMSDGILKKIRDDEVKELEEKKLRQLKLKEEMEQFSIAREMWKAKERLHIQEEEEKRRKVNEEKEKAELQEERKKKTSTRDVVRSNKKLADELSQKRRELEEREELMTALKWEEERDKEMRESKKEMEKEVMRRQEARAAYQQLLAEKNKKKREEKELDLRFAEQMKLKLEEDERKDKEKEEQRRQQLINNRKYNEGAMRENVQKRAESLKLTQLINELEEKEKKRKDELVQEERLRILREHAPKLLGYFTKGVLKEGDLEALGLTGNSPLPLSCPLEEKE